MIASMLAGCAGGTFGDIGPTPSPAATADMAGRWILVAPNAPTCGMNFGGASGAQQGSVRPEGGCPGNFFTSRRWRLDQGMLVIDDEENRPLAQFTYAGGRFEGQAAAGMAVTLTRQVLGPT